MLIGEVWLRTTPGSLATWGRTSCTRCSTSPTGTARGTLPRCAVSSTRRWRSTRRSVRPPPGCSPVNVDRVVSRYGRSDTAFSLDRRPYFHDAVDLALGTQRARAAALLTMALPGSVYIYQGEELGLGEVQDIPDELRQDPIWARTLGADPGRDGSRVPLPWSGTEPPFGFSPAGASAEPAAAAEGVARPDRGGRVRPPGLHAPAVPRGAASGGRRRRSTTRR